MESFTFFHLRSGECWNLHSVLPPGNSGPLRNRVDDSQKSSQDRSFAMIFPMSEWRRGHPMRHPPRCLHECDEPSQDPSAASWSRCLRASTKSKRLRRTSQDQARFFSAIARPRQTSNSFRSANTTSFTSLFMDMSIPKSRIAPRSSLHQRTPAKDDGLLQVREIRDLHLNADLVTLSACDTGVGPVGEEGVENIVNAFIEAGAQSVVSTLWELQDHSTAELMANFYAHLGRHEGKAEALRQAQLAMLNSGAPPYYWAGFELDGDPNSTLFGPAHTNITIKEHSMTTNAMARPAMPIQLVPEDRRAILENVLSALRKRFYSPEKLNGDWQAAVERHKARIEAADTADEFEKAMSDLLAELHTSHIGFFHSSARRASSRAALSAAYLADETPYGKRWIFQDVHSGGAASIAGIEPGDILLTVDGREITPPEHPVFPMGKQTEMEIVGSDDQRRTVTVDVARPKGKKLHFVEPTLVEARQLRDGTGYLKIAMFPGHGGS